MIKNFSTILIFILSISNIGCSSKENEIIQREQLKMYLLQKSVTQAYKNGDRLSLYEKLISASADSHIVAYAMFIDKNGNVIAHSEPSKSDQTLSDEITKNVLKYRDSSQVLVQRVTLKNDRDGIDLALPIYSEDSSGEYIGAVRIGRYLERLD